MSDARRASFRYFSGTGNSKRIAEVCEAAFAERGWATELAALPGGGPPAAEASAACFVFPVYSLDVPRIVRGYLESLPPARAGAPPRPALILVTGGSADDCGWSLLEARRILSARGYDPAYADLVRMPNNWGPFMRVPTGEEAATIRASGEEKARGIAAAFLSGERFAKPLSLPVFGPLGSRLVRALFKLGVRRLWTKFRTDGNCVSCGLCARECPTGSITMSGGGPSWSRSCEQCMRCFNICPSRAILQLEAIGHGSRRERYLEPHFSPARGE
jgi:ferredoxin